MERFEKAVQRIINTDWSISKQDLPSHTLLVTEFINRGNVFRDAYCPENKIRKPIYSAALEKVLDAVEVFGQGPIILKDYVKSRKHDWNEACYIPDASNTKKLLKVVKKFVELQGDELNEGLVFKEFVNLEFLSYHPQSGAPLSKEFRIFFLEGKPLITMEYWDEGIYDENKPDLAPFIEIAKKINSHFFTMDIAKVENG
ncbi:ATP-grasp domain-containing protein [Paenibacillus sp. FSL H8-0537]|uniref:ATP-grasp domain-containing protein n=1 Tax=Paenibacillus sp. FSL H8-0537 TaxID=2921399 RepID=UPI003100B211